MQETQIQSLGQTHPLEKGKATNLSGKAHGQRSLAGYSPWGHQESRLSDNKYITYIFICVVCPAF